VIEGDGRPDEELRQFIEDFASTLVNSGIPRMPARVFSCLLVSESGRMTAAELAEWLRISAGAVSGAVQYLSTVNMVRRTRDPGSRRDVYVVEHDVLYQAMISQDKIVGRWTEQLELGVGLVGPNTAAGERLGELMEFVSFLRDEMAAIRERWADRVRLRSAAS
jgi:predicted transcriptional regulator